MPFSSLGLSPVLTSPLARLGYRTPTPVQVESIPIVLRGADLLARAQTGTGKTAAFALPMIDRLIVRSGRPAVTTRKPRGLVLVPTRELAVQVHKALSTYGAPVGLKATVVFGGVPIQAQLNALRRGADVVVATPGRLIDHLERRSVDLSAVEILTLDEADRMLDMGFLPQLRRVLAALPRQRQTLLLSATFSKEILRLSTEFTRAPERVDVSEEQVVASTVTHLVHPVADGRKGELLRHVLAERGGQALVFCKTKRGSNRVGEALGRAGLRAAVIHGNKSQGARNRALGDFKAGRVSVLVATDLAARGLDIAQLPLVVNYDLPLVADDYVHRVGRTGRAGLSGRAVSLVSASDRSLLADIQRLMPAPLEHVVVEGFEMSGAEWTAPVEPTRRPRPNRSGRRFGGDGRGPSRPPFGGSGRRRRPSSGGARTPTA